MKNEKNSVSFVVVSGLDFPKGSRKYLMNLMKQIVEKHDAAFVIIAGHAINGTEMDKELKLRWQKAREEAKAAKEKFTPEMKEEVKNDLIKEMANRFNEFLPAIKGVNYHIVVAEKIYDHEIGYRILEVTQKLRGGSQGDIRLFNDTEAKIPVQLEGFDDEKSGKDGNIRVLVPNSKPWFYKNVTGVMQRLIDGLSGKAQSPAPRLIVVGCTGTGAFIPRYCGTPCIAVPTHHKLHKQTSTENMVGCTVVTINRKDDGIFEIVWQPYDYRTVIFNEKELSLPKDLNRDHHKVLEALQPSSASLKAIENRLSSHVRKPWSLEKVQKLLDELKSRRVISYNEKENRFAISEALIEKVNVSLEDLFKNSKAVTYVQKSCWHVGALKSLTYSVLHYEPLLAEDSDAIIVCGDICQGISHNYEYNGELLPTLNGVDKQQLMAAKMQAKIIMDVFAARWAKLKEKRCTIEAVRSCLVTYLFKEGNHDEPRFSHSKDSIALVLFATELRRTLVIEIIKFLEANKCDTLKMQDIEALVTEKVLRIGELSVAEIAGIPIGLQHPHQGRTQAKGARIQQTSDFFRQGLQDLPKGYHNKVAIVGVANFHEAAAICTSAFGRTTLGIMTASELFMTTFENNFNKVVEYGLAKVRAEFNEAGQFLTASVRYVMSSPGEILKEDREIVMTDKLTNEVIARHCQKLHKQFDVPWR